MNVFRRLAAATMVSVFALVGVGGLVRATDSGLGCPGWPRCFGHLFPPFGQHGTALYHALIESSHRYITSIVLIEVAALVILALTRPQVRRRAGTLFGAVASAVLLLVQAGLGAAVVLLTQGGHLNPAIVTVHYANAMLLVAALVFTTVASYVDLRTYRPTGGHRRFARQALIVTIATYVLILIGTYVRGRGAGLVFTDWPLMDGRLVPPLSIPLAAIQFAHRAAALVVFVALVAMLWSAARREGDRPAVRATALVAAGLFLTQALLGAGFVWSRMATFFVVAHELTGSLVWGSLVAVTLLAFRMAPASEPESLRRAVAARRRTLSMQAAQAQAAEAPTAVGTRTDIDRGGSASSSAASGAGSVATITLPDVDEAAPEVDSASGSPVQDEPDTSEAAEATDAAGPPTGSRLQAYLALTKPGIIVLLLITTVPAMVLAKDGWPSPWLILATLFGGTLAAGGANVINCYIDRDIDEVMRRTRRRPLPSQQVSPVGALWFGVGLGVVSFAFLAAVVNLLAAALALAALLFYVFVYTLWMKRTTPQNIVIGGAAGAAPALVGWAAVTGRVGWPAVILFLIVFAWTPPHFWALSMRYERDYREAGVPMLPVVRGIPETTRQILLYSFVLVAITLVLYPVARLGPLYLTAAVLLGLIFIYRAYALRRDRTVGPALRLFHYSNTYLALLFAAVAADPLVRAIH